MDSPIRIWEFEGRYQLSFDDFGLSWEIFEEMGYESGGYGWHGALESLLRMKNPALLQKIEFDPESSLFSAHSTNRDALEQLAALMQQALDDPEFLREALSHADPELMD